MNILRILLILFILVIPGISYAKSSCTTCTYPGTGNDCGDEDTGTFCAASCTQSDIQTAVTAALASGVTDLTVYVPACDIEWTPGQKLIINTGSTKDLRLIGYGEASTKIKYFQMGYGASGNGNYANLIEWGHMYVYSNGVLTTPVQSARLRAYASQIGKEIYWHHLTILDYKVEYPIHLEGWLGVISSMTLRVVDRDGQNPYGITIHGNGQYSNHKADLGTRNAFFIEDSTFTNASHSVSLFCNAFVVFRYNAVIGSDSYVDIHGPNYNGCAADYPGNTTPNDSMEVGVTRYITIYFILLMMVQRPQDQVPQVLLQIILCM